MFILLSCLSSSRETILFNDDWLFSLNASAHIAMRPNYSDSDFRRLNLPHDWSIESDFSEEYPATPGGGSLPGGHAFYRKHFYLSEEEKEKRIFIRFDGVYRKSNVWINGHFLGFRPSGYISFEYEVTDHLIFGGENVVAVEVDNSEQPNSRWYSGSGIYRNVWITKTSSVHIPLYGVFVYSTNISSEFAEVVVETKLSENAEDDTIIHTSIVAENGSVIVNETSFGQSANQTLQVYQPHLWNIDDPYLYSVLSEVIINDTVVDIVETKFGIRSAVFDVEKGFFLNGKSLKLLGVCNHHDLGLLGAAINTRAIERQILLLKEMGANAIRTSHNPPAPELLDLCDKYGILVMDEAFDMWKISKTKYDYSLFFEEWGIIDLTDQIRRDRNHPSVIIWSIGNEIPEQWIYNSSTTQIVNDLASVCKKEDPTRPITNANNNFDPNSPILSANVIDLVGYNYNHESWPTFHDKYPTQKFIVTESTSALESRGFYENPSDLEFLRPGQPGWYDYVCSAYDNVRTSWGSLHETSWKIVKENDFISGFFIWTGFDYLGEPTPYWWPPRSSYFGIIDLAGIPKDVFYMYQSEWTTKNVLHLFPHWNWEEGTFVDVWAYYNNADEVELYLNNESLGIKRKENDIHVWWRVPFIPGNLKAVSRKDGKTILTKEIKTAGSAVVIALKPDRTVIKANGVDLCYVLVEMHDSEGNFVPTADNFLKFSVQGSGFIVGSDNGDQNDHTSLSKPERKVFNGKAVVCIQSTTQPGNITLIAEAPNEFYVRNSLVTISAA